MAASCWVIQALHRLERETVEPARGSLPNWKDEWQGTDSILEHSSHMSWCRGKPHRDRHDGEASQALQPTGHRGGSAARGKAASPPEVRGLKTPSVAIANTNL